MNEKQREKEADFMSLSEAAKLTGYTPEYLNSLSRKRLLQAKKIGRNWHTKKEWLNEFLATVPGSKKIELSEKFTPITISTDHINLNIQIDQLDNKSIKIESFFALTGIIGIDEIEQLEKAFHKIAELNNSTLLFQVIGNK